MWGNIAIAFLLAFIVSFMATPYSIKIAEKSIFCFCFINYIGKRDKKLTVIGRKINIDTYLGLCYIRLAMEVGLFFMPKNRKN